MTSLVCAHWRGGAGMLKSCLLGEAGDQTLQSGSDHTWEYLNFNQKKPLEEQQVEAMGSDQHVHTECTIT